MLGVYRKEMGKSATKIQGQFFCNSLPTYILKMQFVKGGAAADWLKAQSICNVKTARSKADV